MMVKTEDEDRRNENTADEVSIEEKKRKIFEAIANVSPDFSWERSKQLREFQLDILASGVPRLKEEEEE
jgi:hypothetical protein